MSLGRLHGSGYLVQGIKGMVCGGVLRTFAAVSAGRGVVGSFLQAAIGQNISAGVLQLAYYL